MVVRDKVRAVGLAARVGRHVAREKVGPKVRPTTPEAVPPSAESITTEWLTAVLCRNVPGARVVKVGLGRGDNGTSARRAVAVTYNEKGATAGLPTRLFTKSTATFASRLLLGLTEIVEGETLFYNRMRPELTIRSPRSFHACFDPRTYRSLVLVEDLAHEGWKFPDPLHNRVTRADAEDMVSEMATYHAAFWDSSRFDTDLRRLRPAREWQENLNRKVGFEKRTLVGLERAREVVPRELYADRNALYPAFMRSLELHRTAPATLLHQDVHLGNWLRDADGRMGLYDWQCVARGHWALDYSYALAGGLATEDRRNWEKDLLNLYLERLGEHGVGEPPSFEEAWLGYRQQPMHALVFGLFTLGGSRFEPELQPRDYTLAAIKRIAQHVVDLESINAIG
ncbi:phosphotransferase [Amycolatopsis acidicola]|uniref:Phosphotransferase n=1 Tax=Amycolatopsis acidicola TaxID=2596893 RepID=A0A5N0VI87_9PSEU|nr:phosphotransferase [Amycolatopsis acidicola]KAA9165966.1 phosphotransferase [Amycolatopsis acidicola]